MSPLAASVSGKGFSVGSDGSTSAGVTKNRSVIGLKNRLKVVVN